MILSYNNSLLGDGKRHRVHAIVTTDHSASHYGQPVVVLDDGDALDLSSWVLCNYHIEKANKKEMQSMAKLGLI
jgi:hypothetical protein